LFGKDEDDDEGGFGDFRAEDDDEEQEEDDDDDDALELEDVAGKKFAKPTPEVCCLF